jgi:LysR family transcriptional regulator, transcriptional activator for dmlA
MGMLDDTAIFAAIIQQGGFSHAAKHLGLSNGLISRRIARLESTLGVTLIKRTTRQLHLTPEGELFWQHAQRIQQELDSAISLIQSSAKKPKGSIRLSAPPYFGRQYLTPIITKFLTHFNDIKIDLILSNQRLDPIKEDLDLVIRGAGYLDDAALKDSNMQTRLLIKEKICLYASPDYLLKQGEPDSKDALANHIIINYMDGKRPPDQDKWEYVTSKNKRGNIIVKPKFNCNDIESSLIACSAGYGIGKFTELNAQHAVKHGLLRPVLKQYCWGQYHLFAVYAHQQSLPKRTRLLLEFINAHTQNLLGLQTSLI